MTKFSIVGKKTPKQDSLPMVTGEAKYGVDIMLPRMLYGKVLYSPHPHARILKIDTTKAEKLPAVKAVITGKDTPGKPFRFPWGPPPKNMDSFVLARDKVRYTGDAVAVVAAEDEETAEEALELIDVEFEVLPFVTDLAEATGPEMARIHDFAERNIMEAREDGYGDVAKGFKESDYVREDIFQFANTSYMTPEVQGGVVSYDATSGKYTFWTGAVWAYPFRLTLAEMLDVPYHRINVITPFIGGSFGGKGSWVYPAHLGAAILSRKTGRPVKIVNTREEDFTHRCAMHQTLITLKTGFKKDGSVVARDAAVVYDIGAYSGMEASIGVGPNAAWFHAPYTVPNLRAKITMVYTNNPPHGPFRSYGNIEPIWACELQLDMMARELGIEPIAIRAKNAVQPYTKTPFGWDLQSCGLNECMEKVGKAIDWKKRGGKLKADCGKGLGSAMFTSPRGGSPGNPLSADVIVNSDGTVDLIVLGTDGGTGQYCAMRMIVAEELGIPLEDVKRPTLDTDASLENPNVSIVTISIMGRAPQAAAIDARQKILAAVAEKLEAHVDDLEAKNGRVYVKGNPEKGMPFTEAARAAIAAKGAIVGKGEYVSPIWEKGFQHVVSLYNRFGVHADQAGHGYGVAGAEVEVDRETGFVRVLRMANSYDVGFALNPLAVEGQLEGGAAMTLGMALTEEMPAKDGQLQNPSYLEYHMPTALDMPEVIPIIVESTKATNDPQEGPFGAKELGMGVISSGHAIISAIYDATGVMMKEFPATPERVLKALRAKKKA